MDHSLFVVQRKNEEAESYTPSADCHLIFSLFSRLSGAGGAGATGRSLQQQIHEWHAVPHGHASHLRGEQLQQLSLRWPGDLGEQIAGNGVLPGP